MDVVSWALAISIVLGALGSYRIKPAKSEYIRRSDPNDKKKNDYSNE